MSERRGVALRIPIDIGAGPAVVLLPGFALPPAAYGDVAHLIADVGTRVIVPEIYRLRGAWRFDDVVARVDETLHELALNRVTMIAHSFAGAIQLGYATRHPERIVELVFTDTLAVSREWPLAEEASRHPLRLLWLATPRSSVEFLRTALTHPRQLAEAGWFGFTSGRTDGSRRIAELGLRTHVLWANRDSILRRADGREFAREMGATFTVADAGPGHVVDHDWVYRHPQLFVAHLKRLELEAFGGRIALRSHDPR